MLQNSQDFGVQLWPNKVYTNLNLICTDPKLSYLLLSTKKSMMNIFLSSIMRVAIDIADISGALKYGMPKT